MKRLWVTMLLCIGCQPLWASEPRPQEFAFGLPLSIPLQQGVCSVPLPEQVYRTLVRADRGDMRVFNQAGEVVPHALRQAPAPAKAQSAWQRLPCFALAEAAVERQFRLELRTGKESQTLTISNRNEAASGTDGFATAANPLQTSAAAHHFLIDVRHFKQPLREIRLSWQPLAGATRLLSGVRVEASHDLEQWSFVTHASLADLRYAGETLLRDTIALPPKPTAFLRLSLDATAPAVALIAVMGRSRDSAAREPAWLSVAGQPVQPSGAFEYDTGGRFPVEQLELELAQTNDLAAARIFSRAEPQASWQFRAARLFYRLEFDGQRLQSGPASLSSTSDRYWRVELAGTANASDREAPRLRLGYPPHELVVLARGQGPFLLAYGSGRSEAPAKPLAQLLDDLRSHEVDPSRCRIEVGQAQILGGEKRLRASRFAFSARQAGLWAVMLAGVGLLALLAFRLVRQLRASRAC